MTINNNNIFGAFTLNEARGSRLTGDWLHTDMIANYGWFGSGNFNPGFVPRSTVDRIDFSNDTGTASARSPVSSVRYNGAATGNSNYGWFGGGNPSILSTVDRIDFSNDSGTPSVRGPLSAGTGYLAATGNSNYGWFASGLSIPGPAPASKVERIDFSNDSSTASPRGPLSLARYGTAATGNSNYGWFGGGKNGPGALALVDRIDFSNDSSTASQRGQLSAGRYNLAATGNSNYGWFGGGRNFPERYSTVDRIDFSNDLVTAFVRGPLSAAKYWSTATGNSNYGWFGGGYVFAPGSITFSAVDRINFSSDLVSVSPRGPLSQARYGSSATSGVLNIRRQKAGNYGWFGGGATPTTVATVDRIDFSNDSSTASVRGPLSFARRLLAATGNSNYGWFGGGLIPTPASVSTVDRIDFSNDSGTASPRGPLSTGRYSSAATGNSNYGWFGGGGAPALTPSTTATVDRIDFSNDSATASPRGPLTSPGREGLTATGNSNYGWFGGSIFPSPVSSRVDRINFSNDSVTASARGPLSRARSYLGATGNSNYSWFGGGNLNLPGYVSTVDRINSSNDLVSLLVRGPLSVERAYLAATGNSNYGWFGGGYSFPGAVVYDRVDRINFSNDSVSVSLRGLLSAARYSHAATSNTNK